MKVQIIIGSTRPGRVTERIAKWVASEARGLTGVAAELVDLKDYALPFFDEAIPPQYNPNRTPGEAVKKWLTKLAEADGYVVVSPEYNRSYPAVLKNALDQIDFQIEKKPVAFVTHGTSGGAQAVSHLRGVLPELLAVTVPRATLITGRAAEIFHEDGAVVEGAAERVAGFAKALQATLTDLKWYGEALTAARANSSAK
jgi:NAD(P)H-dependent FMN reductase